MIKKQSFNNQSQLQEKAIQALEKANKLFNQQKQSKSKLIEHIIQQEKQKIQQLTSKIDEYIQEQIKLQAQFQQTFKFQQEYEQLDINNESQLNTVEMAQLFNVKEIENNKFNSIRNTIRDMALMQRKLSEEVNRNENVIFRIEQNLNSADSNASQVNKYLASAIKSIQKHQKFVLYVFLFVLFWIVLKKLRR